MGEWSEYFEDFPEENPANYVGERFDPAGAKRLAEQEAQRARVAQDSRALQKQMFAMADAAKKAAKTRTSQR